MDTEGAVGAGVTIRLGNHRMKLWLALFVLAAAFVLFVWGADRPALPIEPSCWNGHLGSNELRQARRRKTKPASKKPSASEKASSVPSTTKKPVSGQADCKKTAAATVATVAPLSEPPAR